MPWHRHEGTASIVQVLQVDTLCIVHRGGGEKGDRAVMKRAMLELLIFGGMAFVVAGLHGEVGSLRQTGSERNVEIAKIQSLVARTHASAGKTKLVDRQYTEYQRHLEGVSRRIAALEASQQRIEEDFTTESRRVARQVTEAIGTGQSLSKTVESTQRLVKQRSQDVRERAARLERRIETQNRLFDQLRAELHRDPDAMTRSMLAPTVQLSGEETVGSATIVGCIPNQGGTGYSTYALTANHVVRNILADDPELETKGIHVTIFTSAGRIERKCDVLTRQVKNDLALVKLRGSERVENVARIIRPARISTIEIWSPVFAIGCPLGNDPIPTGGFVSSLDNTVRGTKYWMINAPTYYGNSGGGIFDGETHELIAVFSKIYTHGSTRPVVIPHMGLAVPMSLVYPWLEAEGYAFLIPGSQEVASPK